MSTERLENKIDRIAEDISSINVTLAEQHISLKEHMRRTAALEDEMKPLKTHMYRVSSLMWVVGALATLGALYEIISRII